MFRMYSLTINYFTRKSLGKLWPACHIRPFLRPCPVRARSTINNVNQTSISLFIFNLKFYLFSLFLVINQVNIDFHCFSNCFFLFDLGDSHLKLWVLGQVRIREGIKNFQWKSKFLRGNKPSKEKF